MQAVILAGGLGTRMRPATDHVPKALLPVLGHPFADYQLSLLRSSGFDSVVYCIAHLGEMIRAHVGDGERFGLKVTYADEGDQLLGTGGALRLALDSELLVEEFFVVYGDSYLPTDFRAIWAAFGQTTNPALMTVFRNDNRWIPSNAVLDGTRIALYDKRASAWTEAMQWVDYGISVIERGLIEELVPSATTCDLAEVCHALSLAGRLDGYEVAERFYEIGSPNGLADLERLLTI